MREDSVSQDPDQVARLLAEFEASPFPTIAALVKLGDAARPALPKLEGILNGPDWERVGDSEWEDAALLRHGWDYYRSQATTEQLEQALQWPNSRAVVEAGEELLRRGWQATEIAPHLLSVVGGCWGQSAGRLLRDMGDQAAFLDEPLFEALRAGKAGAARALGQRHPARVVDIAMGLNHERKDVFLARRDSVRALLAAGDEAIPEMLRRLLDPPGPPRDQCELALLELDSETLDKLVKGGILLSTDVSPTLARRLLKERPEQLLSWALASDDDSFREITANFRAKHAIPIGPAATDREQAFVVATAPELPDLVTLKAGLSHTDPLVVWGYLQRAGSVPHELRDDLGPELERLSLHDDEYVGEEASRALRGWVGFGNSALPDNEHCANWLAQADTRLAALRQLILVWPRSEFRSRWRSPAFKAACQGLEDELRLEQPRPALIRAGLRFLEKARNPRYPEPPVLAQLAQWKAPAPTARPASERLAEIEARLTEQVGTARYGRTPTFPHKDPSRLPPEKLKKLDEALRESLTRDSVAADEFRAFGPHMVNVFLRLRLTEPEVWTAQRLQWAMYDLLEQYPTAWVDAEWILGASKEGLSYDLSESAIHAGHRDKRVLPALRQRMVEGTFQEWELTAYARLAPPDEVVRTLGPLWRGPFSRRVIEMLAILSPARAETACQEMLEALEQADPTLRDRILKALPAYPRLAAQSRQAISALGMRDEECERDAIYALRALPDGPESHPLLLSMLHQPKPSWWALELLVRGKPMGTEVASGLLAYLLPSNGIYEHERMALSHLGRIIESDPQVAQRISRELKERFRPTAALVKLAGSLRPGTLRLLTGSLTDPDPDVSEIVIKGFHAFADQDEETVREAATALRQALEGNPEHRVRCYLIRALGHLQPEHMPELTAELKSSFLSPRVIERRRAADVLASWGNKARQVAPLLESYIQESTDKDMPGHLRRALSYIGG